ncbi:hypothetical protein [Streptomyces sp. NPDC020742]|uniref:hypothetical protein n=1 Tax=unclassified Streptomyces TaxID=2593676 RepID=UPI0033CC9B75
MHQRVRKAAAVTAAALLIGLVGTPAAHAEGHKTSYIKGWTPFTESSRWTDRNVDSAKTTVKLSGCATDSDFRSATLTLYRNVDWGRDTKIKSITHKCGTYSWGHLSKGTYYFTLSGFSGGGQFWAKKVVISW